MLEQTRALQEEASALQRQLVAQGYTPQLYSSSRLQLSGLHMYRLCMPLLHLHSCALLLLSLHDLSVVPADCHAYLNRTIITTFPCASCCGDTARTHLP